MKKGSRAVYTAQSFDHLKGLTGISDAQVAEHLDLYTGYVKQVNALMQELAEMRGERRASGKDFGLPRELDGSRSSTTAWSCTSSTFPT